MCAVLFSGYWFIGESRMLQNQNEDMGGGGDSLKNGVQVCVALKTPFSHSPGCLQDPHFNIFHFLRPCPTFTPKSQISRDFKFQSLKISRGKLQSFKLSQNSVHMATLC